MLAESLLDNVSLCNRELLVDYLTGTVTFVFIKGA